MASAEELLSWAGIPRRTETATMGFQRVDDDFRVQRTKEFLNMPPNQSPTALIVGIHPPPPGGGRIIELSFRPESDPAWPFRLCELVVTEDPGSVPLERMLERLRSQVASRVARDSVDSRPDDEGPELDSDEEVDPEAVTEGGDDSSIPEPIDLTPSLLHKVLASLGNLEWVEANIDTVRDLAKPATIIDGQHRIKGAAACERQIPFAVCAMFDCPWPEQVFQFTVVNYSSEGIPDQFITANAALSLTEDELASLQARLVQAQVKVIEYELMRVVQFDNRSPFFNLVNLSEGKDPTKIGYKTMIRIARDWYSASHQVLKHNLLPALFPRMPGRSQRQRLQLWREDLWGEFFIDFWTIVRDHYQSHRLVGGSSLWTIGGSNLMIAIVLYEVQKLFFEDLNAQDEEFFEVPAGEDPVQFLRSKLRQRAGKFVTYVPSEFFAVEWGIKSLNTSAGRKALQTALQKLLKAKGRYQYEKSALVTGETG